MSETANENTEPQQTGAKEENSNHIAGCGIFLVILCTVIFIISVATYSYFDYKKVFVDISEEEAVPTKISTVDDTTLTSALDKKFSDFSALVNDKKLATMELTIDEINLAIAHFEKLSEFKNTFYITDITNKHIEARSSFEVTAGFDGTRHFNGLLKLKPVIAQGSIFPIVAEAIPDTGAKVPEKILNAIPVLMFVEYRNDEEIQNVFHKLTKVELKNRTLLITSDPAATEIAIIDMDVSEDADVGLQLFVLLTFIFITTVAFAIWFSKYRKKQKAAE